MYNQEIFEDEDCDVVIAEEAEWEASLATGTQIVSKTLTHDSEYRMTVIYLTIEE